MQGVSHASSGARLAPPGKTRQTSGSGKLKRREYVLKDTESSEEFRRSGEEE